MKDHHQNDEEKEEYKFTWLKKHSDAAAIITVLLMAFFWLDGKFETINNRFDVVNSRFDVVNSRIDSVGERVNRIENRLTAIETVLMVKNILPCEMAKKKVEEK